MAFTKKQHAAQRAPRKQANMDGGVRGCYRTYSDQEKAHALETLNLCGGNVMQTERLTGIPEGTIREWRKGDGVSGAVFADFAAKRQSQATAVVRSLNARLAEALCDEGKIESARYGELVTAYGVTFDKLRLMDEKPTAITENRNDAALRERAMMLLERLLPEYANDRVLALAAMRENAPTLSEYVN